MSIKKKVNQYYNENIQCENGLEELKEKLDLKPTSNNNGLFYQRRKMVVTFSVFVVMFVILGIIIIGLGGNKPVEKNNVHLIELNVNPSIQFTIDDDNKVLSVYGVNDEGKMLISGEVFIGKSLDQAIDLIIELEKDYGYLIPGNIEASENTINVSVSSDSEAVISEIKEEVTIAINAICEKYNINKVIETVNGYTLEALRTLAIELDPTLTVEKVATMSYQELLLIVEQYHLEVIDYASVKLEEMYQEIKNQKIEFAKSEAANDFIQKVDNSYQEIKNRYLTLYSQISLYVNTINTRLSEAYNSYFLDPESDYQKALKDLETLKAEIAALDQKLAEGLINNIEYGIAKSVLELAYVNTKNLLDSTESFAQTAINTVANSLNSLLENMAQLHEELPLEIKTSMEEAIHEVENNLNENKDDLMNDFEDEYSALIQQVKDCVENRKSAIKNILAGTPA